MKKIFFLMAITLSAMLVSCGGKKSEKGSEMGDEVKVSFADYAPLSDDVAKNIDYVQKYGRDELNHTGYVTEVTFSDGITTIRYRVAGRPGYLGDPRFIEVGGKAGQELHEKLRPNDIIRLTWDRELPYKDKDGDLVEGLSLEKWLYSIERIAP